MIMLDGERMSILKITIPPQEAESLTLIAKKQRITPEEAALRAIKTYTVRDSWLKAQKAGEEIAQDLGIKTDDDVQRVFFEE